MTENTNVVTSEEINIVKKSKPKKAVVKQDIPKGVDKIVVYFESGAGYLLPNGFKFSDTNRMAELDSDEAYRLLALDNFRLPNDEEKEMYYNSQEV